MPSRPVRRRGVSFAALPLLLALPFLLAPPLAEAQQRKILDHDAYEIWRTIGSRAISPDGRWVSFTLDREIHDGELVVRSTDSNREYRFPRGAQPSFTDDASHLVFLIRPHTEEARAHRRERRPAAEQPRDSLGILNLGSGEVEKVPGVRNVRVPSSHSGWVAYHLHPASGNGNGELVVRPLPSGEELRFPDVSAYALSGAGAALLFVQEPTGDEAVATVRHLVPESGEVATVMEGTGSYRALALSEDGSRAAFLHALPADTANEGGAANPREFRLHLWEGGDARVVAEAGTAGIPDGWQVSENGSVSFSRSGTRLFFGTAPTPTPVVRPDPAPLPDERVNVEIWHYRDPVLMTVQTVRADQERRRSYQAVLHLTEGRVVQLADRELQSVNVGNDGDADLAVGQDGTRYGIMADWESPNFADTWLVDVRTGERQMVREMGQGFASLSPEGRFLTWYEASDSTWYAREIATGAVRDLGAALPHPVHNERHDSPSPAGSYGSAGWLEGDRAILLYDRYDVWAVDPTLRDAPRNLTRGAGREAGVRYRMIQLDREARAWSPEGTALLSAFHEWTKDAGFYRTSLSGNRAPERLLWEGRNFSTPVKAARADRLLFTQETFQEFPDLWVSGLDFRNRTRVSEANPQQAEYRWGTTELVEWTSNDGVRLQGVLMKPEGFDPSRKYPMVVYFYERWSDGLHSHYAMVPHRSRIAFPMYTSRDYLVFIPDIVYRVGYPGESALNAVNPGVLHLMEQGFVDRDRIALQGHSWGGYQIAFMVTRSQNLYRAGAAGAPVANMTSAYGGIRRETGLVRQFQYERTQSRLGGSLWETPLRYLENSPLFFVDKIETPLLIMHNDRDGHVPWEQGIELFTAMRRLGKPAWMVNYNDEPHWPTTFANRVDWNIRMQQFFDHFLKDAPPPVWMVEGIPAVRKGETLGYDLVPGGNAVVDGGR